MARSKGLGYGRPSIHNVAAYAGVSIATVSKVMQGVPTVRPENVVAVQNAIEALGYRLNPLASELRRGRRTLIGAIVPRFDNPWAGLLIGHLEVEVEARGHTLLTASSRGSPSRESELVARMQDWRASGLVVLPAGEQVPATLLLRDGPPCVFVDHLADGAHLDAVLRAEVAEPGWAAPPRPAGAGRPARASAGAAEAQAADVAAAAISLLFDRIAVPDRPRDVQVIARARGS